MTARQRPHGYSSWPREKQDAWYAKYGSEERTAPNGHDERAPKKPPSRVLGAGTFMRSYEPISYTIDGILPSGYLYGLTAKPGTGKTAWKIAATFAVGDGPQGHTRLRRRERARRLCDHRKSDRL